MELKPPPKGVEVVPNPPANDEPNPPVGAVPNPVDEPNAPPAVLVVPNKPPGF